MERKGDGELKVNGFKHPLNSATKAESLKTIQLNNRKTVLNIENRIIHNKPPKVINPISKTRVSSLNEKKRVITLPEEDLYSKGSKKEGFEQHIEYISGPILLTSPHGLQVYRGGVETGEEIRLHQKERFTNEICVILSKKIKQLMNIEGSFVIWNTKTAKKKDPNNLDPNYLLESQFMESPWHLALLKFKKQLWEEQSIPIFHIDIHGKKNRKDERDIDVGMAPMSSLWDNSNQAILLHKVFCDNLEKEMSFIKKKFSGFKIGIKREPYLNGYWGDNTVTTLSHQSILLDVPACQLEIPYQLREEFIRNEEFSSRFTKAIVDTYKSVICPMFNTTIEDISKKLIDLSKPEFEGMTEQIIKEFLYMEQTEMQKQI
ncbi:hypothetical protein ABK040_008971 [Willaertia magna]